jgi:signal transduction histidine kinase
MLSLVIAWASVLVAAAAAAALLWGAIALSERRGAFVSAVTHELRTPLTTFLLYTEMLDEGMLAEEKRNGYVTALRGEAERVSHLVENVLAYSQLEGNRARAHVEDVALGELLGRPCERLRQRAAESGMEIVCDVSNAAHLEVRADRGAVELILFNLVDNACKYASSAEDKRIHVDAAPRGAVAAITVRDHGPGVSPDAARRLFRPFSKSAHDAANSAPGVGLGLSLCRRLARSLGGDLVLDKSDGPGASFTLTLPLK